MLLMLRDSARAVVVSPNLARLFSVDIMPYAKEKPVD